VEGPEPLPFAKCLAYAGVNYNASALIASNTLGNIEMGLDSESNLLTVIGIDGMNYFGKQMGYRVDDKLVSINGMKLNADNFYEVYDNFLSLKEGEKVTIIVLRKNKKGIEKEKKLKGKVSTISSESGGLVEWTTNPTDRQLRIRKIWLNQ
jgi:C-terminal processing protease CtpA/Prc